MGNPWNDVSLEAYESHMSLSDVAQLQTLKRIMQEQVKAHPKAGSAVVIGVAGGNGLEHFGERFGVVYGIDVNPEYLKVCEQRLRPAMGERLQLIKMDMSDPKLHQDITEPELTAETERYRYKLSYREYIELPNGKQFIRIDYRQ